MSSTLPNGFLVRPVMFDDFESVLYLISDQNRADYGEPMISAEDLRDRWQSPDINMALDTWVVIAPDGALAAYADLQRHTPAHLTTSVYLNEGYQDKEIGLYLLQLVERRAVSSGAGSTRISLTSRASENHPIGKQIFERTAYRLELSFLLMETVLTRPPQPAFWASGITVREFISGQDEHATYLADEEASQDKGYHRPMGFEAWAKRMNLYSDLFDPTLWFLACDGNELAGAALNIYSPATHTGWIDHLSVRRAWRNQGIGKALLLHSFGEFYRRGISRVKLSVDSKSLTSAPRLYERVGMRTIQQYNVYTKTIIVDEE